MPRAQYLTSDSEIRTQETIVHKISNEIGPTSFGFSMKKLLFFYLEHLLVD
jgi:hypothetical protein